MVDIVYKTPSKSAWRSRRTFHLSQKDSHESDNDWLHRIQNYLVDCDYGSLADFMLIDKFVTSSSNDLTHILLQNKTIEVNQLQCIDPLNGPIDDGANFIAIKSELDLDLPEDNNDMNFTDVLEDKSLEYDSFQEDFTFTNSPLNSDEDIKTDVNTNEPLLAKEPSPKKEKKKSTKKPKKTDISHLIRQDALKGLNVENLFKCDSCDKTFNCKRYLKKHIQRMHLNIDSDRSFECYLCKHRATSFFTLRSHFTVRHRVDINKCRQLKYTAQKPIYSFKGYKDLPNDRATCLECGKNVSKSYKKSHARTHTGSLFKCEICNKTFTEGSRLRRHLKTHNKIIGRTFECYVCKQKSDNFRTIRSHYTIKHCIDVNFIKTKLHCTFCNKLYFSQRTLDLHLKVHQGLATSFDCPQCDKVFEEKQRMLCHLATHSNERHFICEQCGRTFKNANGLRDHKRSHIDAKPFKCKICDRLYKTKKVLRIHMRVHTGERPYSCELCSKTFTQKSIHYNHMKLHDAEKPHNCPDCGKGFVQAYHMKLHMRTHTGDRPYACDICGRSYIRITTMNAHKRKDHPNEIANILDDGEIKLF